MPEPLATPEEQAMISAMDDTGNIITLKSDKTGAYYTSDISSLPHESFWHPVKALEDLIQSIKENTRQTNLLLKQIEMERDFIDVTTQLGATIGYLASYNERRKYIYATTSATGVTLQYGVSATVALTAGKWTNISPPRGSMVTINNGSDSALITVTFRLCDFLIN